MRPSGPVTGLIRGLGERASTKLSPPVVGAGGPMTETAIHLRDAARPLGLDVNPDPSSWLPVLDFLVSKMTCVRPVASSRRAVLPSYA